MKFRKKPSNPAFCNRLWWKLNKTELMKHWREMGDTEW